MKAKRAQGEISVPPSSPLRPCFPLTPPLPPRAGFLVSARAGSGIVIAKLPDGSQFLYTLRRLLVRRAHVSFPSSRLFFRRLVCPLRDGYRRNWLRRSSRRRGDRLPHRKSSPFILSARVDRLSARRLPCLVPTSRSSTREAPLRPSWPLDRSVWAGI